MRLRRARLWAATKPLVWRSILVSKQSVRVATGPHQPIAMRAMPILPGLSPVATKSLTATFDAGRLSSDGGFVVLREIERRLGLAETITGPLHDARDPARIRQSYA